MTTPTPMSDEQIDAVFDSVPWKDLNVSDLSHVAILRRRFARALLAASPAEPAADTPAQSGEPDKWVAKVRVTHKGYSMELSKYIAYALPEGVHELYAASQPEQAEWALIREAMRSLSTRADELKASNTSLDGTWCDADEEAAYNAEVDLIERLRTLLAAQPANGDKT